MKKTYRHLILLFILISLIAGISSTTPASNKGVIIHFLDVGQADSTLIQLPNNRNILIDAGNNDDGSTIVNYLKNKNIDTIVYIIGTHPHEDHIGGLDNVIDSFKIGKIYLPKIVHNTKTFEDLLMAIHRKKKKIITARAAVNIINEDNLKIFFISPLKANYQELNHYSAVVKLEYHNSSFLFTGDAEVINEEDILEEYKEISKSNLLKVGHHGSISSTSNQFLNNVDPEYAIISVGKDNSYGHPSPVIIKRLNNKGIKIYRTDQQGTIIASSDGNNITFNVDPVTYTALPTKDSGIIIESVDLHKEVLTIKNKSDRKFDLTDWKLLSVNGSQEYIFPRETILNPGDYIKIISGPNAISKNAKTLIWTKSYIWNNNGDIAELYDKDDNLISRY